MLSPDALEHPCPRCGYDLRATPWNEGRRCPECGTVSLSNVRSRIPWVHRRHRGTVAAFLATLWMVYRRPGTLAREPWINPQDARAFHRRALLLATLVGTTLLLATFFARGDQWRHDLGVQIDLVEFGSDVVRSNTTLPMYAFTDSPWIAIPLAVSTYLASALSLWVYRLFLRLLSGKPRHRARVQRVGLYASALLSVTMLLLGLLALGGMVIYEEHPWLTEIPEMLWKGALILLAVVTPVVFYVPTIALIWTTGRWRVLRIILMLLVFPYTSILVFYSIVLAVFFALGYCVLAVYSMLH